MNIHIFISDQTCLKVTSSRVSLSVYGISNVHHHQFSKFFFEEGKKGGEGMIGGGERERKEP